MNRPLNNMTPATSLERVLERAHSTVQTTPDLLLESCCGQEELPTIDQFSVLAAASFVLGADYKSEMLLLTCSMAVVQCSLLDWCCQELMLVTYN
jgi:hypothetical protein